MAEKKTTPRGTSGPSEGLVKLKKDLKAGQIGRAYLFYGQESYLREHYLGQLRKVLVPDGFEEFNYHRMEGRALAVQDLADAVEGLPMMAERTLTVVSDLDLYQLGADARDKLVDLLQDLPPHCCLVFVYDTVEYAPNRTMKKLYQALAECVEEVEFRTVGGRELVKWVGQHFQALGKEIDPQTAEYLIFTCGDLMTGLAQEIEKIGAYARGETVTQADIDAVAIPVLSAETFRLSDAVLQGQYDRAAAILGDLLKLQTEPIQILATLGGQLRRIYTARLAIEGGKGRDWLMDLWGMRSDYPAKLLLAAARRTTLSWCAAAVKQCQVLDRRLKSEKGIDGAGELKLLLVRLGAGG